MIQGLDRLPILLFVHDGEEDRKVDDETLVLRKGLAECICHVKIGTVVSVNDTDDVLNRELLRL